MGGNSGGGGRQSRGGGASAPVEHDLSQRGTSSQNEVSGGFTEGNNAKIVVSGVPWNDKNVQKRLKGSNFEFDGRNKVWHQTVYGKPSKGEVESVIKKVPVREAHKIKVSNDYDSSGPDRW